MASGKNQSLHGNVPDNSRVVLLVIDAFSDFRFPGGSSLAKQALPAARNIAALKRKLKASGIPTIYINDNAGKWHAEREQVLEKARGEESLGKEIAALLLPEPEDYFVLKTKHSCFFGTTLDQLLKYLGAECLILTGIAGDNCIFFTAADAFMRDLRLCVPRDCVRSIRPAENALALRKMHQLFNADLAASTTLRKRRWKPLRP